jgi:EAL domain-containing protein (putative c-di-GMP-specific phosphodiesterase class I)
MRHLLECIGIPFLTRLADFKKAMHFIVALKERGCHFALDEFGIGLSLFSYLKTLPVDYLKIDGRFIRDITEDPVDDELVQSIHRVGNVMRIKTIAESVEIQAVLERIKAMMWIMPFKIYRTDVIFT